MAGSGIGDAGVDRYADIPIYAKINTLWSEHDRAITDADRRSGKLDELLRICRDRLGGRDEDLIPPGHREKAQRDRWSKRAAYFYLPRQGKTWKVYVHNVSHFLNDMLPKYSSDYRDHAAHTLAHARLELELSELVTGWFIDEEQGINHSFPSLELTWPPETTGHAPRP
jgi:hypothetical protein